MAYDSNRMDRTRRNTLGSLLSVSLLAAQQPFPDGQDQKHPFPHENTDEKLPNGKSQKNEIAKLSYEQSLKDVDAMVEAAESLRDDLRRSGTYTVSVASLRKTEEIEKLARKIRGRLKA